MRRAIAIAIAAALAPGALAALPAVAHGQTQIRAVFFREFSAQQYNSRPGQIVTFRNDDPFLAHGVRSASFAGAGVVRRGGRRLVWGAPYLPAGTYPFWCPVHPGMTSRLRITGPGSPLPPDGVPPIARPRVRTKAVGTLIRKGRVRVTVNPSEPVDVFLRLQIGKRLLARAHRMYAARPGRQAIVLRINRKRRALLRRRANRALARGAKRLRIRLVATSFDAAGNRGRNATRRGLTLPQRPMRR